MEYIINHIPKNTPHNRRPGIAMTQKYLTIHSTGNLNSTAKNERGWLTNPTNNRTASFHIVVDEKEAIEILPLNETAWHAGDGRGQGNMASIGIEICESGNRQKTLNNAIELVAKMLKERGWDIDRLKRHYDWSGKICPRILQPNNWQGWEQFKKDVKNKITEDNKNMDNKNMDNKNITDDLDWGKEEWEWAKKEGWLDGTRPKDPLTRREFAIVLQKIVDRINKPIKFL